MILREFIKLCMDHFCGFIIYDESDNKRKFYSHPEEVISNYGDFIIKGWMLEKDISGPKMFIKVRAEN